MSEHRRRLLMACYGASTPPLPYDARIKYLQGDGAAYIDSGVNFRQIVKATNYISFATVPSATSVLYGAWWEVSPNSPQVQIFLNNSRWNGLDTAQSLSTVNPSGTYANTTDDYRLTTANKSTSATDTTAFIFARNHNGGQYLPTAGMRLRATTMETGGAWVRDFYPVRIGTVGYLYDRLTGTLLPNSGGGAFILGADTPFTIYWIQNAAQNHMQGQAIYGNKLVRAEDGTTMRVYTISSVGELTLASTLTLPVSDHNNSMQFAPTVEAGQTVPLLYVSGLLPHKCMVYQLSGAYDSVTLVQTITMNVDGFAGGTNLQIGDDGYLWAAGDVTGDHYRFVKFRQVGAGEGDVTLTSADILDDWTTAETFPTSSYVWQGMKVKRGKIWFVHGHTGAGQNRGVVIYDCATHAHRGTWSLADIDQEFEDLDFWGAGNDMLISCYSSAMYRLTFDNV